MRLLRSDAFCLWSAILEANINEFFSDAVDEGMSEGLANNPVVIERLRAVSSSSAAKTTILDKDDLVLGLCDLATFNRGTPPHQGLAKVIRLRNALPHFIPEWQPGGGPNEDGELASLSRSLRRAFPENPLAKAYEPFFPHRCLGYGSSKWAITQSIAFVTEFRTRLGVGFSPTYLFEPIQSL